MLLLPESVHVTLYIEREFADGIKNTEGGEVSGIIWVGSKYRHKCPHEEEAEKVLTTERRRHCDHVDRD